MRTRESCFGEEMKVRRTTAVHAHFSTFLSARFEERCRSRPPACTRLLFSAGFSATYDSSHGARSSAEQSITRLNALTINCGCSALHHSPLRLSRVSSTSNLKNTCTLPKALGKARARFSLSLSLLLASLSRSLFHSLLPSNRRKGQVSTSYSHVQRILALPPRHGKGFGSLSWMDAAVASMTLAHISAHRAGNPQA